MTADPAPRLAPGVRIQDGPDGAKLLAPERVLELDEIARAIVAEFDGKKRVSEIARALAAEYDARAGEIQSDIERLLADLAAKGYVKP